MDRGDGRRVIGGGDGRRVVGGGDGRWQQWPIPTITVQEKLQQKKCKISPHILSLTTYNRRKTLKEHRTRQAGSRR
jgi:hypothetical protein